MWSLHFTKQAQKDARKLALSGFKQKAEDLLAILELDPSQTRRRMKSWWVTLLGLTRGGLTFSIDWSTRS